MTEFNELTKIFKCLAVEARLKIIQLLQGRVLCVNALAANLNLTQGAVSQHLRILRD
ncbi:MAG: metalloregulator ArsR/SmtB family transcription factor, partial [Pseudomonadota bacterium]